MSRTGLHAGLPLAFAVVALLMGCSAGTYVWVHDLPPQTKEPVDAYVIGTGDVLNVRVFGQADLSVRARVRRDGQISVPFVGDVQVQGKTPAVVAKEIETRLATYVNSPKVTVVVEEFQPITVAVLGEVVHPGTVTVEANGGVLQALANAGGLTEFANRDRIFVIRRSPTVQRIRFTYEALSRANPKAASFSLIGGDAVVVE